jgi:hypothetical protein
VDVNDADNDLFEIELDPFQNFRFRRRPPSMTRFSPTLTELGTNFDLSKFAAIETIEAGKAAEDSYDEEELQRLSMISALQPPTTFRPLEGIVVSLIGQSPREKDSAVSAWRKGLKTDRFGLNVESTSPTNDVIKDVNKFRHLISERL